MNSVEPSGLLYQRLSSLDPDSASKIMGFVLIHGPSDADMLSLASAPDVVLHQLICRGKSYSRVLTTPSLLSPTYASVVNLEAGEQHESNPPDATSFFSEDLDCLGSESTRMFHKRSFSQSDAFNDGVEWRQPSMLPSSPGKFDAFEQELIRARANQQQRLALASQIMSDSSHPYSKFFADSPRLKEAMMMMGEELQKLGQFRSEFSSSSRQIYLTFPVDSTFKEEDVSNYFSMYGPVQDVRIPYQQKRMFGFVTFVHPETVRIILAKGNPHFVCDSRVLVKPYKEKGKAEKKLERGDLSSCSSPHGVDIRDFDVPIDLLMRRKLEEQAEFQQALDMQSRKMTNLHLSDLKNVPRRHSFSPSHNLSPGAAISSPTHHPLHSPNHMRSMGPFSPEAFEENNTTPTLSLPPHALVNRQATLEGYPNASNCNEYTTHNTNEIHKLADSADNASLNLVLPDTLDDAIPPKMAAPSRHSIFSHAMRAMNENPAASSSQFSSNSGTIGSSACLSNVAPPKSRFLYDPSFGSVGNRAIEM